MKNKMRHCHDADRVMPMPRVGLIVKDVFSFRHGEDFVEDLFSLSEGSNEKDNSALDKEVTNQ